MRKYLACLCCVFLLSLPVAAVPTGQDRVALFQREAAKGHVDAQYQLGRRYYWGLGVPQDYGKAAEWWQKAAKQGDPYAQFWLGYIYEYGLGVPRNMTQAAEWYQKADKQGHPVAVRRMMMFRRQR